MAGENLKVTVGADLSQFTKGLKDGERGYATFRDRVGSISEDVGKHLEQTGRHWQRQARELGRIGRTTTESLGALGGTAGVLADQFKFGGQAAELFAGASGLGGIALMVATGGPLVIGLGIVAGLIALSGRNAKEAEEKLAKYKETLGKLTKDELTGVVSGLQSNLSSAQRGRAANQATIDRLRAKVRNSPGGADLGIAVLSDAERKQFTDAQQAIAGYDETIKSLATDLKAARDRQNEMTQEAERARATAAQAKRDHLNSPEGRFETFSSRIGTVTAYFQGLAKGIQGPKDLATRGAEAMAELDRRIAKLGNSTSETAKKLIEMRTALKDAIDTADLKEFDRLANLFSGQNSGPFGAAQVASIAIRQSLLGVPYETPIATGIGAPQLGVGKVRVGGMSLPSSVLTASKDALPKLDKLHQAEQETRQAITEGLNALPQALSGVLMPMVSQLLGSVFGGGRGAQIGGALGTAFGSGAGGYLGAMAGAKIGGLLGSAVGSVVPVIGTAIGGLIGAGIGSLFSHHKKAVDDNTSALQAATDATKHLAEQISNLPAGIKVERYRYGATTPTGSGGGTGTGGSSGSGTGGGPGVQQSAAPVTHITIAQVVVNGVTDVASLAKKLGDHVQAQVYRGGTTPLRTAFAR